MSPSRQEARPAPRRAPPRGPRIGHGDWLERRLGIPGEAGIVAAVLLVWQAARIPVQGSARVALAHAHEWISLQRTLGLSGVQNDVISLVQHPGVREAARWSYDNLHVVGIFAFMIAFRAAAPERYPRVRTAFVALHIPAFIAIAGFPLASPFWLPHLGAWAGGVPTLGHSLSADLRNRTATVASEHFGYPALIAAATLWAARGRLIAWPILLYPTWVFLFIVGTGRHYPLDTVVGTLCVAFGFMTAHVLHRGRALTPVAPDPPRRWIALATGAGLLAGWVSGIIGGQVHLAHPTALTFIPPAVAAIALAVARGQRRPPGAADDDLARDRRP